MKIAEIKRYVRIIRNGIGPTYGAKVLDEVLRILDDYERLGGGIMTELRKCPFCGGEAIIVNEAIRENGYGETIKGTAIGCRNCECHMFYRNRELAIEAWNRRTSCDTCAMYFPDDGCMAGLAEGEE